MSVEKIRASLGTLKKADPERYILSVLPPQERLEAALRLAQQAFRDSSLTADDIEAAIRKIRRKLHAKRRQTPRSR